jgi:hypothetical protein
MDMEKSMEMLARIAANQEEAEANRKADMEELKSMQENWKKDKEDMLKVMRANQHEADIMLAKLDAYQEDASADRKADKEEMEAKQIKAEARHEEKLGKKKRLEPTGS